MLLASQTLALLVLCTLSAMAQLTGSPFYAPADSQLVFDGTSDADVAWRWSSPKVVESVIGTFYHCLASFRERIGRTQDSYRTSRTSAGANIAPRLLETRMSYLQTSSVASFSKARRSDTLAATIEMCKESIITNRRKHDPASRDPWETVLYRACCQARHYGVLQTCVKITFDGTDPDEMDSFDCRCEGLS